MDPNENNAPENTVTTNPTPAEASPTPEAPTQASTPSPATDPNPVPPVEASAPAESSTPVVDDVPEAPVAVAPSVAPSAKRSRKGLIIGVAVLIVVAAAAAYVVM